MKSITACCTCPKCGQTTKNYHGTYMQGTRLADPWKERSVGDNRS